MSTGTTSYEAVTAALLESNIEELNGLSDQDIPEDALCTAALGGHDILISRLLERRKDINYEGLFGSPLRISSLMGHESTVRLLLGKGASLQTKHDLGSALQAAASSGHVAITKILVEKGGEVVKDDGYYGTALQAAVFQGHADVVGVLLDAGADMHDPGLSKDAFHAAAEAGQTSIIRLFLERGYQLMEPQYTHCCGICQNRHNRDPIRESSPSRVALAKNDRDTADAEPDRLPEWESRASILNYADMVRVLKGSPLFVAPNLPTSYRKAHLGKNGANYALEAAAVRGHISTVRLLLDYCDSINMAGFSISAAFSEAAGHGKAEVIEAFLESRVEMMPDVDNGLDAAASDGHLDVLDQLLDHIALYSVDRNRRVRSSVEPSIDDLRTTHERYRNILMRGACGGHIHIITRSLELIGSGCSISEIRRLTNIILTSASSWSRQNVLKFVLQGDLPLDHNTMSTIFRAACTTGDAQGQTALMIMEYDTRGLLRPEDYAEGLQHAVTQRQTELAKLLLEKHPNMTIPYDLFLIAAGNGSLELVQMLKPGLAEEDEDYADLINRSLCIASRNGHKLMVEALLDLGGDVDRVVDETPLPTMLPGPHATIFPGVFQGVGGCCPLQAALQGCCRFRGDGPPMFPFDYWSKAKDETTQEETVSLLIQRGAGVHSLGGSSMYPLQVAARSCSVKTIELLLQHGADPNATAVGTDATIKLAACRETEGASVLKALFDAGMEIPEGTTSEQTGVDVVLGSFEEPQDDSLYPIRPSSCSLSGSVENIIRDGPGAVLRMLLSRLPEQKALDHRYGLVLQMATIASDYDFVKLLLDRNMDVNWAGGYYGTALQAASRIGALDIAKLLIERGADVNILQGEHSTAIRAAVLGGHEDIVSLLIEERANPDLKKLEKDHTLNMAIKGGNANILRLLLKAGAKIEPDDNDGIPALLSAVQAGNTEMIALLLAAGADANEACHPTAELGLDLFDAEQKLRPLHIACKKGNTAIVSLLLAHGASVSQPGEDYYTPLHAAVDGDHPPVIRLLFQAGAEIDKAGKINSRPLYRAALRGRLQAVPELLEAGASVLGPEDNALQAACTGRHYNVVETILKHLDHTSDRQAKEAACAGAVSSACVGNNEDLFQLLLAHGTPLSTKTLCAASAAGMSKTVRMLLDRHIGPNDYAAKDVAQPLHIAAYSLHAKVVQLLVHAGADLDARCQTLGSALTAALLGCVRDRLSSSPVDKLSCIASALPVPGSFLYSMEDSGTIPPQLPPPPPPESPKTHSYFPPWTPDMYTGLVPSPPPFEIEIMPRLDQVRNCEEIVWFLISRGVNISQGVTDFGNALHLASYLGSEDIVRSLLTSGMDVNNVVGYFDTPLMAAVEGDHLAIVQLLLEHGANVNAVSRFHGSALQYACQYRGQRMIQLLLAYGANKNASGGPCGSPLAAAYSRNSYMSHRGNRLEGPVAITRLLLGYGEKVKIKECDLMAAAGTIIENDADQRLLLKLLKYDPSIQLTEEVVIKAASKFYDTTTFRATDFLSLLDRTGGIGVTEGILKAVTDAGLLRALLQYQPQCPITPDILVAVASPDHSRGLELVQVLIQHQPPPPITEEVVAAVLKNYRPWGRQGTHNLFQTLLTMNPNLQATEEMLKLVKQRTHMQLLLARAPGLRISPATLEAVSAHYSRGDVLVKLLLEHDDSAKVTEKVLVNCLTMSCMRHGFGTIEYILEREPELEITGKVFLPPATYADGEKSREWFELLGRFGKTVRWTEGVERGVRRHYQSFSQRGLREMCYALRK